MDISILCHLYYERLWDEIRAYIDNVKFNKFLYFNVVDESFVDKIKKRYPEAKITISENRGADIGGYFSSIEKWMEDGCPGDIIIKCHTKNSDNWRRNLFDPIFDNLQPIVNTFKSNDRIGLIGSKKCYNYTFEYPYVRQITQKLGIKYKSICFIGGTVFCIRSCICKDFFGRFNPSVLKNELEPGKPREPSKTHAWERILGTPFIGDYFMASEDCYDISKYNEEAYLNNYPDVKVAIEKGKIKSGLEHYLQWGRREKRVADKKKVMSANQFDEKKYLERYPDVKAAVSERKFKSGYMHYLMHGFAEGREL